MKKLLLAAVLTLMATTAFADSFYQQQELNNQQEMIELQRQAINQENTYRESLRFQEIIREGNIRLQNQLQSRGYQPVTQYDDAVEQHARINYLNALSGQ
jgi:hypothetical protein